MKKPSPRSLNIPTIFLLLALGFQAAAQSDLILDKAPDEIKKKDGWDFLLTPGLNLSLSSNRSVIGQPEGLSMTVGASVSSGARFRKGPHEWRSSLNINELFTRTPTLEEFVKSTDIVKLESMYLFHLLDWLGPFAKINIDTVLLEGFDARSEPVSWVITRSDGTTDTRSGFHLRLNDGFAPLTFKETAGFFASPYNSTPLKIEGRLGFGGQHVFANDALAIQDDGATDTIEVITLKSYSQAGGLVEVGFSGELYAKRLIYTTKAEIMIPFLYELNKGDDRDMLDLTNIEFSASLSFRVFEWLSLDYVFRAIRQPQLLDEFQLQNNILLTASYTFFKPEEEKK